MEEDLTPSRIQQYPNSDEIFNQMKNMYLSNDSLSSQPAQPDCSEENKEP